MSEDVIDLWKDEMTDAEKNNAKDKRNYRININKLFHVNFCKSGVGLI